MKKSILFLFTIIASIMLSCNNDDDDGPLTASLTLSISGLEDLGPDFVYEGWIIVNGAPISTGIFTSTAANQTFILDAAQLNAATRFVLSIEPEGESGTASSTPSDTKLLVGDFVGNTATVSVGTVGDFDSVTPSGMFFLRAPTDEPSGTANNGNDESGIWFGSPGAPPSPALTLPTLEVGWKYEGWVVVDGIGPLSTGTFTAFDVADENAGASTSFSGTENNGPPIPGEDFFNNVPAGFTFPLDLRGRTIVISVEPFPDNSPNPFLLKPLLGTGGQDTAPATYDLVFSNSSFPTGTADR